MSVTVFQKDTGRILWSTICPPSADALQAPRDPGVGFIEGSYRDSVYYIRDGSPELRPEMPLKVKGSTLYAPPHSDFEVVFDGQILASGHADDDGILEFDFTELGEYLISLSCFPYLDAEVTINAD